MKGKNELVLCTAEMLVAVQEYLDKRMGDYAPLATDVIPNKDYASNTFNIKLEEKSDPNRT